MKSIVFDLAPWAVFLGMLIVLVTIIDDRLRRSESGRERLVDAWLSKKLDLDKWLRDDPKRSTLSPEGQWYLREAIDALAVLMRHDGENADPEDRNVYVHLCSHISQNVTPRGPLSIPSTSE